MSTRTCRPSVCRIRDREMSKWVDAKNGRLRFRFSTYIRVEKVEKPLLPNPDKNFDRTKIDHV